MTHAPFPDAGPGKQNPFRNNILILLSIITVQTITLSAEEPTDVAPIELLKERFPISKLPSVIKFDEITYFRAVHEKRSIDVVTKEGAKEPVIAYSLNKTKYEMPRSFKKNLAAAIGNIQTENASNEQVRPWAGGIRIRLVAFSADDTPQFTCDLQTTTPTEVAFARARGVDADTVRSETSEEYLDAFYYEVRDPIIAAILFAIAIELNSPK
jgi:hypothetical protein